MSEGEKRAVVRILSDGKIGGEGAGDFYDFGIGVLISLNAIYCKNDFVAARFGKFMDGIFLLARRFVAKGPIVAFAIFAGILEADFQTFVAIIVARRDQTFDDHFIDHRGGIANDANDFQPHLIASRFIISVLRGGL